MSFYKTIKQYSPLDFDCIKDDDVKKAIEKEFLTTTDLKALLSQTALPFLEQMAKRAHGLTLQNFGKTISLYTPLYLSNFCINSCIYCGFNINNKVARRRLTLTEVKREAQYIANLGLKHILILTGETKEKNSLPYIKNCIKILKKYFTSISIEIYPLKAKGYKELIDLGVDGLTIYQEVYDENIYSKVHIAGPKTDYKFRLDAPERAAKEGIRTLNVGALLGLGDFRSEAFFTILHAHYLQNKYLDTEVSISVPRIQPHVGDFKPNSIVSDTDIVQMILAMRIFMPRLGIVLSTREKANFRDNLLPLGITKMSAGSTTAVGGHTIDDDTSVQFDIADNRSVAEIKSMLLSKGYQPVLKDWL